MTAIARRWRSLRWRLPALFIALIAVILTVFLWTTARALKQVLASAGGDRAQVAADQVSLMMTQGVVRGTTEARRVSGLPDVAVALKEPTAEHIDAAKRLLTGLAAAGQPPVQLWTATGTMIASAARAPAQTDTVVAVKTPPPRAAGLTAFHVQNQAAVYELVTEVPGGLGYVVTPRTFSTAQTGDALRRLVGGGAFVMMGNQRGDVWTDFARIVPGPPVDATRRGPSVYHGVNGDDRMGAMSLIPNSPWAIWVDFPESAVLAPARVLLRRMVLLAIAFIVAAAVLVAGVSAKITTPLLELTHASEEIAAGRYDQRVPAARGDEIGRLGASFNTMTEHVATAHRELEQRVEARTAELQDAVRELEAFSYSVSHDLRAPLRHIDGFAALLAKSSGDALSEEGRRHLATISGAAGRMGRLIDDLIAFSRVGRAPLACRRVDLNHVVQEAQREVDADGRAVGWRIHDLPSVQADPALLRQVFVNLLSNAVKYSSKQAEPIVEIGATNGGAETVVYVRDNGEGFDPQYAHKLFGVFQRLHSREEFEGTGIGLANVRRIVQRHGGRTWAEGAVSRGATFYFSLPNEGANGAR